MAREDSVFYPVEVYSVLADDLAMSNQQQIYPAIKN